MSKTKKRVCIISFLSLAAGFLYYLLFRDATLFSGWIGLESCRVVGKATWFLYALPTFLHVFAFSMLTWLLLGLRHPLFSTLLWAGINLFFELLQLLSERDAAVLPSILQTYAARGTFDIADIAAIVLASAVSLAAMQLLYKKGDTHESSESQSPPSRSFGCRGDTLLMLGSGGKSIGNGGNEAVKLSKRRESGVSREIGRYRIQI